MASFKLQIAGLIGITSGTTPTDNELTEFLKDGVNDVTRRCIQVKPQERKHPHDRKYIRELVRNFIAKRYV